MQNSKLNHDHHQLQQQQQQPPKQQEEDEKYAIPSTSGRAIYSDINEQKLPEYLAHQSRDDSTNPKESIFKKSILYKNCGIGRTREIIKDSGVNNNYRDELEDYVIIDDVSYEADELISLNDYEDIDEDPNDREQVSSIVDASSNQSMIENKMNPLLQIHLNDISSSNNPPILGSYILKKTVGAGNFATVKLAQHRITNDFVAIKFINITTLSEDNMIKMNREVNILKKLRRHENIVKLYQVIRTRRFYMLVTEFCSNGDLFEYVVEKGRINEAQVCDYFKQLSSATDFLHGQNIVHRDLKAENLLLTDNYKTIKIADFGFANYFEKNSHLLTWCGSPPYAAPELFNGVEYAGPPVDVWALGVILYVSVCGSLPFDGCNIFFLKSRVVSGKFRVPFFMSTECESLLRGMLRLDPEKRFTIKQVRAHCWFSKFDSTPKSSESDANETTDQQANTSTIDKDVVNAVSNISIDEPISVEDNESEKIASNERNDGQWLNAKTEPTQQDPDIDARRESSIDERIITFMVEDLRVSDNHDEVRQSIEEKNYDDLHAMYSLLKEQSNKPAQDAISHDISATIPPVIIENRLLYPDRPSIIRAIMNNSAVEEVRRLAQLMEMSNNEQETDSGEDTGLVEMSDDRANDTNESTAMDISTCDQSVEEERYDDSSRSVPPQLFVTSPSDNQSMTTGTSSQQTMVEARACETELKEEDQRKASLYKEDVENSLGRRSLDSNMSTTPSDIQYSANLSLRSDEIRAGMSLWDSSILDTLGLATVQNPLCNVGQLGPKMAVGYLGPQCNQNCDSRLADVGRVNCNASDRSCIQDKLTCQAVALKDELLLQISSINASPVMAQSIALTQNDSRDQKPQVVPAGQFMPNNLINQNANVLNKFALHTNLNNIPNGSLLDPNGQQSGFERRASDGQASYNSLSTNKELDSGYIPLNLTKINPNDKNNDPPLEPSSTTGELIGASTVASTKANCSNIAPSNTASSQNSFLSSIPTISANRSPTNQVSSSSKLNPSRRGQLLTKRKKRHSLDTRRADNSNDNSRLVNQHHHHLHLHSRIESRYPGPMRAWTNSNLPTSQRGPG